MLICAGSSNAPLAGKLAKVLHAKILTRDISKFPNGEKRILLTKRCSNDDVVIVQSFSEPVDEHIIELALLINAAKHDGAKTITVVIPWLGYSLQNHIFRVGESLSAEVIAAMLSALPVDKFVFVDLHNEEVTDFFAKPAINVTMMEEFASHAKKQTAVVVSPDSGGGKRAQHFAQLLGLPYVEFKKKRDRNDGTITMDGYAEGIKGKTCILIDDLINTGSTTILAAANLKKQGAKKVVVYVTHILAGKKHMQALLKSKIDSFVFSDSVDNAVAKASKKVSYVTSASAIAAALRA